MSRVLCSRHPLPALWYPLRPESIIAECAVKLHRHSRLRLKVIVASSRRALRELWRDYFGHELGRGCHGAVNNLRTQTIHFFGDGTSQERVEVDPLFYAVMGLVDREITLEVIAHECVHAAYAYAKRRGRCWDERALRLDEELVAYPAGQLTQLLVGWAKKEDLLS